MTALLPAWPQMGSVIFLYRVLQAATIIWSMLPFETVYLPWGTGEHPFSEGTKAKIQDGNAIEIYAFSSEP